MFIDLIPLGDILINDQTVINTVSPSFVPFEYKAMEPLVRKLKRELVSTEIDVACLGKEAVGKLFTLKGETWN